MRRLELLQHRVRPAAGERVAGQQQHRQAVDRRERRAGDHVRRARPDRRRARERAEPVALARVAGGDVDHRLLVARRVVGQQVVVLLQRLAEAGDVAVAEDAEAAGEEALAPPVALDVLGGEEADERLRDGEATVLMPGPLEVGQASASRRRRRAARRRARRPRWRAGSCAPAASPASSPCTSAPPNASPAPRPQTTSTGTGGTSIRSSRVRASVPSGPRLTIASCTPSSSSASAAASGSRVPTATSTSSRLPTATVACASAARAQRPGSSLVGPEHRAVVEVVDRHPRRPRALLQRRERRGAARLGRQPGPGRPEHARLADRVEVELVRRHGHVGRLRLAVEQQREVVGREDLAEHDRRAQRRVRADERVVDAEAAQRGRGCTGRTGRRRPS